MQNYHPIRKKNEITNEAEKLALLKWGKYVTIAMCENNTPYIVSLSYGYDAENTCLYFHCANKGEKLSYIEKNPNVCATLLKDNGYLDGQCDHDYETLIIRGKMSIITDLKEKKHALLVLLNHLEKNLEPILERTIKTDASYNSVSILKLEMESIVGKKYRG